MKIIDFKSKKTSMHRKLSFYMLTLVLVVVAFIGVGLFFVGHFSTTTEKYSNNLTFQNKFYTRQIEKYFDDITMMSEMLAADSSAIIDDYLTGNGIDLRALDDSLLHTEGVQKALFPKLKEELLKADASGAQICAAGVEHENALARARRARRGKERRQHHQRRGLSAQTGAHVGDVGVRQILKGLLLIEHVVSPEKFFGGFLCTHSGLSPVRARFPASGM